MPKKKPRKKAKAGRPRSAKARGNPAERNQKSEKDPTASCEKGLPLDHPRRCTATNGMGERCRNIAVEGVTVCRMHGGASKRNQYGPFRYVLKGRLKELIERMDDSADVRDLRSEIKISRAILQDQMDLLQGMKRGKGRPAVLAESLQRSLNNVADLVKKLSAIEDGLHITLDMAQANELAACVIRAVTRHVKDPKVREAVAAEIMAAPVLKGKGE